MLRTRGHSPASESAAIALGRATEHAALWHGLALAGAVLHPRGRGRYLRTMRAVAATQCATSAIKLVLRRERPVLEDLPPLMPTVSGLSSPSAHASTSFAAAKGLGGGPFYALALLVAVSRPFLGLHYPSDTLAGAALGHALARLTA